MKHRAISTHCSLMNRVYLAGARKVEIVVAAHSRSLSKRDRVPKASKAQKGVENSAFRT